MAAQPKAKVIIQGDATSIIRESKRASQAMGDLGKDITRAFESGAGKSKSILTGLAQEAGQIFGTLKSPLVLASAGLAAVTAAAYKVGQAVFTVGPAFDKSMANVATLLDTTKINMKGLGDQVIALALKMGRSPALLADALYQWISAGGDVSQGLGEFGQAVTASIAGVTDATTAVDGITTILNSYGKEARDAGHVSDWMFQVVNKGKIDFTQLAQSIGLVAPTAKGAGVGMDELGAAIATATAQGIRPTSAMEGLRSAIANIIKPSDAAITTAKLLGIQWGVQALRAKGLSGLLKDVREKTKGNTEAMAQLFGDISGLNVVLSLTGEGAGMFADNLLVMQDAAGSTDQAFAKQKDTWTETAQGLAAVGDAAATWIFNKFKPILVEAGQWVINNWPAVLAELEQTGSNLAGIVSVGLTPFKLAWDAAKGAAATVVDLLRLDLKGAAADAGGALQALGTDITGFKQTWESITIPPWAKVLAEIGVTIVGAKLGVEGLTVALKLITPVLEGLTGLLDMMAAGSLVGFLSSIGKLIGKLIGGDGLAVALAAAKEAFAELLVGIIGTVDTAVATIPVWGWIAAAVIAAAGLIYANWDKIGPFFHDLWDGIKLAFTVGLAETKTAITQTLPEWWAAFQNWLSTTLANIGKWFADLPSNIAAGVVNVGAWLGQEIPKWGYAFGQWLGTTLVSVINWFLGFGAKIATSVAYAAGWLSVEIPKWAKAFGQWLGDTWTAITTWFDALPAKLLGLLTTVATFLTTTVPSLWNAFSAWLGDLETTLTTWFSALPGKFVSWLQAVVDAIPGLINAFIDKGKELANAIWQGMKDSIGNFFSTIPSKISDIATQVKNAFTQGQADARGGSTGTTPVPGHAAGGIFSTPHLAWVAEGGEEEAWVPRSRAAQFLPTIAKWAGAMAGGVAMPSMSLAGAGGGFGGGLSIGNLTVIVQAPPETDNPRAFGAAAGDALFERVARMIKV